MPSRPRVVVLAILVVVLLGAGVWYGAREFLRSQAERTAATDVGQAGLEEFDDVPRVVFRSTAPGQEYGRVAVVAIDDPAGPRSFAPVACDRIDATSSSAICLVTERGIATTFAARLLDAAWSEERGWPLPGIPNRTRLSVDGALVATTSFVTGHSYASSGFVTATEIHGADGTAYGNLEDFALIVDGRPVAPVDRNMWGVTFVDDNTFYATAQSASLGHTWLVRGDLGAATLTAVRDGVECPSLSPDGTTIAYKRVATRSPTTWNIALLDLVTGEERLLDGETRNVDDQVEWLDDRTLLYGLPRHDEPGVSDVWALGTDPGAEPVLFIPQAWSPAVVRP